MKKLINILLLSTILLLIYNSIKTSMYINIITNYLHLNKIFLLVLVLVIFIIIVYLNNKTKNLIIKILITVILIIIISLNIMISFIYSKVDNALTIINKPETYELVLVTLNEDIKTVKDLEGKKVGIVTSEVNNVDLNSNIEKVEYIDELFALHELIDGNIDAAIINASYINLYSEYFDIDILNRLKVINAYNIEKKKSNENNDSILEKDSFTILFIGADSSNSAYNADALILASVNLVTKKIVLVDVVRDTYVLNQCNGIMDKITHIGWYSDMDCKLNTVSSLFNDIPIDYYVKIDFDILVDSVDLMGGLTLDLPYKIQVDYGVKKYYLQPGVKKLNGTEVLAYARTRMLSGSSLTSRGEAQMTIIEEMLKQANYQKLFTDFFSILDTVSNNVSTNLDKNDLYLLLQKSNLKFDYIFSHNTVDGVAEKFYHPILKQDLSTIISDEEQIKELSNLLLNNL